MKENQSLYIHDETYEKKIKLGQFFTKESFWLKPQVLEFIKESNCNIAYDPYAGGGDLLNTSRRIGTITQQYGLDIDDSLGWDINDSLINIPHIENAIIITNPPYIAKQSASRKKIDLSKYFEGSTYDDIYLVALDKMLEAQNYVVAIVPESFINSNFKQKDKLHSITILEENPFADTENPVCVACFDSKQKNYFRVKVYKNDCYISSLEKIFSVRMEPKNSIKITFNTLNGWLGLRAIDSTDDKTFIHFDFKENFDYDWEKNIKVTSRHFSLINIKVPFEIRQKFIEECNLIVSQLRKDSQDIIFTPFKGNTKNGHRRRRLDFRLARVIMEKAYSNLGVENYYEELRLF